MRYIIYNASEHPFVTNWFDAENNYEDGMIVFDMHTLSYFNGIEWVKMEEDSL